MRHIIESQQFTRPILEQLFVSADTLEHSRAPILQGKILASLFYEPSTRTRFSFESAMLRLGGEVLTTENAREFSSAAKGETLEDSIRVIQHYADVIVLRHYEEGAAARAARVSNIPIISGGDGAGQHPTQALLDLYTIQREIGHVDGISVAMVGDLKHGRTVRSLCYLLSKYNNVHIHFVAPKELQMRDDIKAYLTEHSIAYTEHDSWSEVLSTVDVVYMTRIQKERFNSEAEYESLKGTYILTREDADAMKEGSIIMHPLPRIDEISSEVDASPRAVYFKQAGYGLLIRMALLVYLLT